MNIIRFAAGVTVGGPKAYDWRTAAHMDETTRFGREEVVFRHVSGSHDLTYRNLIPGNPWQIHPKIGS